MMGKGMWHRLPRHAAVHGLVGPGGKMPKGDPEVSWCAGNDVVMPVLLTGWSQWCRVVGLLQMRWQTRKVWGVGGKL